jgi:hypothetical protein
VALALAVIAGTARAQIEDQSQWAFGDGTTVTVSVDQRNHFNDAEVSYRDGNGTSGTVTGTLGPGSSDADPNVSDAGEATTPTDAQGNPGSTYRCKNGKVERKDSDGTWKKGREKKIKDKPIRQQTLWLGVNQRAPRSGILWSMDWRQSLPIQEGDVAPFDGWLVSSPGDEVVTLPAL